MNGIANAFHERKRPPVTKQGGAGYDNARENIDPHVKTKVVSTQEGSIERAPTSDNHIANKKYVDDNIGDAVLHSGLTGLGDDDHTQYQKETDFSEKSVLFRGATAIQENNSKFFWDNSLTKLTVNDLEVQDDIIVGDRVTINGPDGRVATLIQKGSAIGFELKTNDFFVFKTDGSTEFVIKDNECYVDNGDFGVKTDSPVCALDVRGGFALEIVTKTSTYTATGDDWTIICGPGNETFTVDLPIASGVARQMFNIKNIGTGTITVDARSAETIDGAGTVDLNVQYQSITVQSDGSNWHII